MFTKLVNSKLTALCMGLWIAYCIAVSSYDGALCLLLIYLLLLRSNKKSASAGDTGAQKIILFRRRV